MFDIKASNLSGCYELIPTIRNDNRGNFVKIFNDELYKKLGLHSIFVEDYYSASRRNVIRGLHFQNPPMDHVKIVYCIKGKVQDIIVDLRIGSPTYGKFTEITLSSERANIAYIPKGMAHGFCTLSDEAIMVYKTSSAYSSEHDSGILWNSVGIPWSTSEEILSNRDKSFQKLALFSSPFTNE